MKAHAPVIPGKMREYVIVRDCDGEFLHGPVWAINCEDAQRKLYGTVSYDAGFHARSVRRLADETPATLRDIPKRPMCDYCAVEGFSDVPADATVFDKQLSRRVHACNDCAVSAVGDGGRMIGVVV